MGLLRLILAISVVLAHSSPIFGQSLIGGRAAVESFFFLSGFFMTLIWPKYQSGSHFFYSRLFKLLPLYWFFLIFALIISIIFNQLGTKAFYDFFLSSSSKLFLFLFNLSPFFQDITNYLAFDLFSGNLFFTSSFREFKPEIWNFLVLPQTWAISIEIYFYLLFPLIVRQSTSTLIKLTTISVVFRLVFQTIFQLHHDPWSYRFFPFEIYLFLLGVLSFRFSSQSSHTPKLIFVLPLFIIIFLFSRFPNLEISFFLFYLILTITTPFLFKLTQKSAFDRFLGNLSYPLYLSHYIVINLLTQKFLIGHQYLGLLATIFSILISIFVYFLIQRPIDNYRHRQIKL